MALVVGVKVKGGVRGASGTNKDKCQGVTLESRVHELGCELITLIILSGIAASILTGTFTNH